MKFTALLLISLVAVIAARPEPDIGSWFKGAIRDTGAWFDKAAKDTKDWVEGAVSDTKNWFEGAAVDTKNWFKGAARDTEAWIKGAIKDTTQWFNSIKDKIVNFYEQHIKPFIDDFIEIFNMAKEVYEFVKKRIQNGFKKDDRMAVRNKIKELFGKVAGKADKYFYKILNGIEGLIKDTINKAIDALTNLSDTITKKVSGECRDNINGDIQKYRNAFIPKLDACIATAKKEITGTYELIKELVLSLPDTVFDVIEEISLCVEKIQATGNYECLLDAVVSVVGAVTEVVTDVISFKTLLVKAATKVAKSGKCVIDAVKETVKDKEQLKNHLSECGQEAALDLLM